MLSKTIAMKVPTLRQIITRIAVSIALIELLIMFMFTVLPWQFSNYVIALLDTFLLALIATPIIYFWIIKRYTNAHKNIMQEFHELLRNLNNYKQVLDHHAILATTDIKGNITSVNDKFCEISQYSEQELIGENHRLLNSGYHESEFFKKMYKTAIAIRLDSP
mgnify:CR=1 FL=1